MSSAIKIVTKASATRRPRGQRGFARVVVILAWVAFWANTAFFPCCEAIAASFGDQSAAQVVSDAHPAHDTDETHTPHPEHSPHPPCGHVVSAAPADFSQAAMLAVEHPELAPITLGATISLLPAADRTSRLTAYATPPPKVPLYLRDLRIRL